MRGSLPTSRKLFSVHSPWKAWISRNNRATRASRRELFPHHVSPVSRQPLQSSPGNQRPTAFGRPLRCHAHSLRGSHGQGCHHRGPPEERSATSTSTSSSGTPPVSSSCVLRLWHARPRLNRVSPLASSPVELLVHLSPVVVFKLASVGAGDLPPTVSSGSRDDVKEMVEEVWHLHNPLQRMRSYCRRPRVSLPSNPGPHRYRICHRREEAVHVRRRFVILVIALRWLMILAPLSFPPFLPPV